MSSLKHIQQLMEQVGPATPSIAAVVQNGDSAWAISYGEDRVVLLEMSEARDELTFTADLGRPSAGTRLEVFETLLGYNALWKDTGGVRMAVADGEAMQIYTVGAASLDLDRLTTALENFADKADVWRRYVATAGSSAGTDSIPASGLRA